LRKRNIRKKNCLNTGVLLYFMEKRENKVIYRGLGQAATKKGPMRGANEKKLNPGYCTK
jgi:hypothetical protein